MLSSKLLPAIAIAAALPLAGCYTRVVDRAPPAQVAVTTTTTPVTYVPTAPPEPIVESMPPAPGPVEAYVWAPGHYVWSGAGYVWVHGAWVHRERPGDYVAAHWEHRADGWVYVDGAYR